MALRAEDRRSRQKAFLKTLAAAFNASQHADLQDGDILQLRQDGLVLGVYLGAADGTLPAPEGDLMTERFLWIGILCFGPHDGEPWLKLGGAYGFAYGTAIRNFLAETDENGEDWSMPKSMLIEMPAQTAQRLAQTAQRLAA